MHKHNVKGVIRALEIFSTGGKKKSDAVGKKRLPVKDFKLYILNDERESLYASINRRVDIMIEKGLFDEVENLLKIYPSTCRGLTAIGYKESVEYLSGSCTKDEAIALIKQHTRNYAKRQLTFFKRLPAVWIDKYETEKMCDFILKDFYGR